MIHMDVDHAIFHIYDLQNRIILEHTWSSLTFEHKIILGIILGMFRNKLDSKRLSFEYSLNRFGFARVEYFAS